MKTLELKKSQQNITLLNLAITTSLLETAHEQYHKLGKHHTIYKGWSIQEITDMKVEFLAFIVDHKLSKDTFNRYIKAGIKSGVVDRMEDGLEVLFKDEYVLFFPESEFLEFVGDYYSESDTLYHGESLGLDIITARERVDNNWKEFAYEYITSNISQAEFVLI